MKSKIVLLLIFCFYLLNIHGTNAAGNPEQEHLVHKVLKGDTWYSIAKKYSVTYADLRLANKNASDKLAVGQTIAIPPKPDPKLDAEREKKNYILPDEVKQKVHEVKPKENLRLIAAKYSVTVDQISSWNKLTSSGIQPGQKLIVSAPLEKKSEAVAEKPEIKKAEAVRPVTLAADSVSSLPALHKVPADSNVMKAIPDSVITKKTMTFAKGRKEITEDGMASWIQDEDINPGKYFALHRSAGTGTIIKVTNRMNRRIVFVKVVGKLPDTGDNENVILKISKAAAEKLGVIDQRFQAELNYGVAEQ